MKSQDTGYALVGQNVTWSGGFPMARSPCFHYGRPIKFNTAIYSLRDVFEKTTRGNFDDPKQRVEPFPEYL